jgi:hypothetical protein
MAAFENGNIAKYPPNNRRRKLDPEEYALVDLLENEKDCGGLRLMQEMPFRLSIHAGCTHLNRL